MIHSLPSQNWPVSRIQLYWMWWRRKQGIIAEVYNQSLRRGHLFTNWLTATVMHVFKVGRSPHCFSCSKLYHWQVFLRQKWWRRRRLLRSTASCPHTKSLWWLYMHTLWVHIQKTLQSKVPCRKQGLQRIATPGTSRVSTCLRPTFQATSETCSTNYKGRASERWQHERWRQMLSDPH